MGNEQENSENIVRLETKFEWLKDTLGRIESILSTLASNFASKEVVDSLQKQINEMKLEKKEKRRMLPDIIIAVCAIVSLGLTMYLIFHK